MENNLARLVNLSEADLYLKTSSEIKQRVSVLRILFINVYWLYYSARVNKTVYERRKTCAHSLLAT